MIDPTITMVRDRRGCVGAGAPAPTGEPGGIGAPGGTGVAAVPVFGACCVFQELGIKSVLKSRAEAARVKGFWMTLVDSSSAAGTHVKGGGNGLFPACSPGFGAAPPDVSAGCFRELSSTGSWREPGSSAGTRSAAGSASPCC
jgi:hypothetical protein